MIYVKTLAKEKISTRLKQKDNLEFLFTTFLITLLTITGIFLSHHNKAMFNGRCNDFYPIVISTTIPSNLAVHVVDNSLKLKTILVESI